jgi:hypothetical protein
MRSWWCETRYAVPFCWILLLSVATTALADETPRTYGAKVGYFIPTESLFRDVLGSGVSVGGAYSLPLRPDRWIDFEVFYWRGKGDFPPMMDETIQDAFTYRSTDVILVPFALSLRADLAPIRSLQPFVLGGIDLNIVKEEVDFVQTEPGEPDKRGTNSISNAFLGLHFAAGAGYQIKPKAFLYLELRLSVSNADTKSVGGLIGNGVSLGGAGVFAGLRIR